MFRFAEEELKLGTNPCRLDHFRVGALKSERFDSGRQARQFARNGVLVQNALRRTAHQLRLRSLERGDRIILLAGSDRGFDLLDGRANARRATVVDACALGALDGPLFGGLDIGHGSALAGTQSAH